MISESTFSATHWAEYSSFVGGVSLLRNGLPARMIVMKAAGDLVCKNPDGTEITLTSLPQWYEHRAQVSSISATQTVAVIVYW